MSYAPDKQGPEADARKAEAADYVEQLRVKYGVPFDRLYPMPKRKEKGVSEKPTHEQVIEAWVRSILARNPKADPEETRRACEREFAAGVSRRLAGMVRP